MLPTNPSHPIVSYARVANDGMARICRQHADRMPWFIASLPMNNTPAAIAEVDRVIDEHNAVGFQLFTNVNNKALDQPEFRGILAGRAPYCSHW